MTAMVPRAIDLDCAAVAFTNPGAAIGDLFDLSLLHANATLSGRQGFKWGGTTNHGKGFLWVANSGGQTIVNGNVDDDDAAEFSIAISDGTVGASAYSAADFRVNPAASSWTFISAPDMFNADYRRPVRGRRSCDRGRLRQRLRPGARAGAGMDAWRPE